MDKNRIRIAACILLTVLLAANATATRVKDVASVKGLEGEHLIGYGIIVGLGGTGDGSKTGFTNHSVASMMEKFGHTLNPDDIKLKNVAAVMVTATLPPYSRVGSRLDVSVASLGDASSLEGGILLMTPLLRQEDGLQYAIAQGPVSIGGFNIDAGMGNRLRKNHSTVGRIPSGGRLSRDWGAGYIENNRVDFLLHNPDFTTAANMANAINSAFNGEAASAVDAGRVSVWIPKDNGYDAIGFISVVENVSLETATSARVVINERTGTVVVGEYVGIKDVAIAHGNLSVEIKTGYSASQPAPFGEGRTLLVPDVSATVQDGRGQMAVLKDGNTVEAVATSLNELGVSPRDMIAIFQALHEAGALEAELVIM